MENGRVFVIFGFNLSFFHLQHGNYLFEGAFWTTKCFFLTLWNFRIHEDCRNFIKKCIKTLKIGEFCVFCHFRCQFETLSLKKQQKTVKILGKKCIKSLKFGKWWGFCHFRCHFEIFSFTKRQLSLRKNLPVNETFLSDPLKLSNPGRLSKLYQKMHKNFENWRVLGFLSFSVSIWDIVTKKKTTKNCSEKPTGQHICALLTLFNVSIH